MSYYRRSMYIQQGDKQFEISFPKYIVIMYFAKQINELKASNLFDVTDSEFHYWQRRNIQFDYSATDYYQARYDVLAIEEAIAFLSEIILALEQEDPSKDLVNNKYGGDEAFMSAIANEQSFLSEMSFILDEDIYDADLVAGNAITLREALEFILDSNLPYFVYVE
jgi:hypothetical protein